jgi:hypothetical protein
MLAKELQPVMCALFAAGCFSDEGREIGCVPAHERVCESASHQVTKRAPRDVGKVETSDGVGM